MSDELKNVKIKANLLPALDKLIKNEKDIYGIHRFPSRCAAVTYAVKELLNKHNNGEEVPQK